MTVIIQLLIENLLPIVISGILAFAVPKINDMIKNKAGELSEKKETAGIAKHLLKLQIDTEEKNQLERAAMKAVRAAEELARTRGVKGNDKLDVARGLLKAEVPAAEGKDQNFLDGLIHNALNLFRGDK